MAANHYVVTLRFKGTPPTDENRKAQGQFLNGLQESGTLVLAGKFTDDDGGGVALLSADSITDARAEYTKSPLVQADLVDWTIRPLTVTRGLGTS